MTKKKICVLVTTLALVACISIPVTAGTNSVYLEGKYFDSQFSQRAINNIINNDKKTVSTASVTLSWGPGKGSADSSWRRTGSYKLRTRYVYSKEIKSFSGTCSFRKIKG
ncbi:MAG: hypothetical protein IKH06_04620 [Clostridiales bacterium]|nr:hypothetical protein [Clostridiales bacterium]